MSSRTHRMRALGVLPVGALLTGGLQPAAAHLPRMMPSPAGPPNVPGGTADGNAPPHLSVCSVLDGLLGGAGPTTRGTGNGISVGAKAGHASDGGREPDRHPTDPGVTVDGPLGLHASVGPQLPKPRTEPDDAHRPRRGPDPAEPAPAPPRPSGAGLLGSVADLLGLHAPPRASDVPDARNGHDAREDHDDRPTTEPDPATPRPAPSVPRPTRPADPPQRNRADHAAKPNTSNASNTSDTSDTSDEESSHSGVASGNVVSPSVLRLNIPPLPSDGRLDKPLSLLPLHIKLGTRSGRDEHSRWCLPHLSISLGLGVDAAAYRVRTAAQPFRVRTPLLVLTGLTYHGITEVPTATGPERVLVFTVYQVDIASLRQTSPLLSPRCGRNQPPPPYPPFFGLPGLPLPLLDMGIPGIGHVDPFAPGPWHPCQGELETDGAPFGTAVATGHPVVLLTKVLSGNLLGLLPITFTPSMPPPLPPGLTLPIPIFFTNVTAYNQYLGADELDVPGLHQTTSR